MFKQKMQNGKIKYGEWYIDPLTDKRKRVFVTIKSTGRKSDDRLAEDALKAKIRRLYSEADQPDAITLLGIPSARQGATNRDKSTFYQGWPRQDATQGDTFCHLFVT